MKVFSLYFCIAILWTQLYATEYVVVVNKNIKSLHLGQIKAFFLKKTSYLGDEVIVPINLSPRNPIRISFEKNILDMSFTRLKSYWTKQHYLGHRPPISVKSQATVKAFIKKVDGAIGYMQLSKVDNELTVVYRWSD